MKLTTCFLFATSTLALILLSSGCKSNNSSISSDDAAASAVWSASFVTSLSGFDVPECTLYVASSDLVYVSNIESKPDEYWTEDGTSYLSTIGPDLRIQKQRWLNSTVDGPINAAKGMCVLGDYLYFADITRLMRCDLATGKGLVEVASGFQKANDLASDGKDVWLSDTEAGKIFCISPDGKKREIKSPAGINGLTFDKGKFYGVSWTLHEVYELDPSGENEPMAFGLASHFTNLDAIEVLCDSSFIVSDFKGNKISHITKDQSKVTTIIELSTPADIGLNRKKHLLYVPQFLDGKVSVYQLSRGMIKGEF